MNYTHEEIKNAITIIANVCESTKGDCDKCPFGNKDGDCYFSEFSDCPHEWQSSDGEPIWRAVDF